MLDNDQVLGDFTIVRKIGRGGMGEVYEAQQASLGRPVALKVLTANLAGDDDARSRFEGEIAVLARLDNPHIVRIFTCGRTDTGALYYTMQLIHGVNLAQLLAGVPQVGSTDADAASQARTLTGPVSPTRLPDDRFQFAIAVGLAAAKALVHAHGKQVLHRDIKPSNLMVDAAGHVYLLDFGLHRTLDPNQDTSRPGLVRGTPWYMSPEQAAGGVLDARSDLYALGKTLYEVVANGQSFYTVARTDQFAVLREVRLGKVRPLRGVVPTVPPALDHVIQRCLEADPARRWQSAEELVAALEALGDKDATTQTAPPAVQPRWGRRAAVTVGLLCLVALLWWLPLLAFPTPQPQPPERTPEPQAFVPARPVEDPAMPEVLRKRDAGVLVNLQRLNGEPVLPRQIRGPGTTSVVGDVLHLLDPLGDEETPSQRFTFLTLDDDPLQRPYELTVALGATTNAQAPSTYDFGVFFGWRRPEARFYMLKFNVLKPPSRALFGSSLIFDNVGKPGGEVRFLTLFPGFDGSLPLLPQQDFYLLTLRVTTETVTVVVDKETLDLNVGKLQRTSNDPIIRDTLRTEGAVGIWVRNGVVRIKNARTTLVPTSP